MSYYRLFMSLVLIVLLVPAGTAWAGAGDLCDFTFTLESELMLICQGGHNAGQPCTIISHIPPQMGTCGESSDCPKGQCVVQYVNKKPTNPYPLFVPGTLTFIADDQQSMTTLLTILLDVPKGKQSNSLANTKPIEDFPIPSHDSLNPGEEVSSQITSFNLLFRSIKKTDEAFAEKLFELFKSELCRGLFGSKEDCQLPANLIPVIAHAEEPIKFEHPGDDPLATVLRFEVEIGFAFCDPKSKFFTDCK